MYLISIFLIFSTVSGDFEEIRFRQYYPANIIEGLINFIWREGVLRRDYHPLYSVFFNTFGYTDPNKTSHGAIHFFNNVLLKLNTTIPPKTYDIQVMSEEEIGWNPPDFTNHIDAAVQWGGHYYLLRFKHFKVRNETYLYRATYFSTKPVVEIQQNNDLAANLVRKMIIHEDVMAPEFAYQACDNRTIKNRTELVAEKFKNITIHVPNAIIFYNPTKFIQSIIIGFDGQKHFFEFDAETNRILKAMEYCPEPTQSPKIEPFEKILHRRFEPAIQVQAVLTRIMLYVQDGGFLGDIADTFEFVNLENEVSSFHGFREELKKSSTFSWKILDVQEVGLDQELGISFEGGKEEDPVYLSYLYATVQLGEYNMLLKFKYWPNRDELLLTFARHYRFSTRLQFAYQHNLAMEYILELRYGADVVDSEFVYRSCENGTTTDAYDLNVFPEDAFGITDLVTFQHDNQTFIQFEITVRDRTHYFEINDSTRKFTAGMEYPC